MVALQTLVYMWLVGAIITSILFGILTLLVEYNKKHFSVGFIFGTLLYHAIVNWFFFAYMAINLLFLSFFGMLFIEYLLISALISLVLLRGW